MADAALMDTCKDFVIALGRAEKTLTTVGKDLPKEERKRQVEEFFRWLDTSPEAPQGLVRDIARELVGQLTAFLMYDEFKGSTSNYIV